MPEILRRFWTMVAHDHGQVWNASEIGASLGVSHHTARRYADLLAGADVVRLLPPWFENEGAGADRIEPRRWVSGQ